MELKEGKGKLFGNDRQWWILPSSVRKSSVV